MPSKLVYYRVEALKPHVHTVFVYQGKNAKRDAVRHAKRYAAETETPARVIRGKHISESTVSRASSGLGFQPVRTFKRLSDFPIFRS